MKSRLMSYTCILGSVTRIHCYHNGVLQQGTQALQQLLKLDPSTKIETPRALSNTGAAAATPGDAAFNKQVSVEELMKGRDMSGYV